MEKIFDDKYKEVLETMPICCVDLVIHQSNKVLMVYRKNQPAKGQLWFPGGRIHKNEKLEEAAIRIAFEEVGLDIHIEKKVGIYEVMFEEGPFRDLKSGVHAISICFLATPIDKNPKIQINSTSSNYKWMDRIKEELHPYIKEILIDSKIFG